MSFGISGDNPTVINGLNTANLSLIELRVISALLQASAGGLDTQQNLRNDEALALAQPTPVPSA